MKKTWMGPEEALHKYRRQLEALKTGEGIEDCNRVDPDLMRSHFTMIEKYLDRAEEELQKITPENLDFFHTLIQAAEMRLLIAFYMPHIMRDEKRLLALSKPRFPECDEWMDRQLTRDPDLKSPAAWQRAPDWITDRIEYDRFAKRMTAARKKRESAAIR